ncbi:MAG TPA: phosphatase PAP2 family protein [Nitrospirota bacterium]
MISMASNPGPIRAYRRYWLPELVVLIIAAVAAIVLFSFTDLDVASLRPYYHPGLAERWPVANHPLWSVFYRSAPWVTGSLAIAGSSLIIAGMLRERWRRIRLYGFFILLCVILGPGLVINVALKDHWGRPRPRQLAEFGGKLEYVQPLVPSGSHGKSFPCGHCSVGYLYAAGWWLWRRKYTAWGAVSLATGLVLGTLLGIGRMAAGAHFLSDAVWSALIAYGIAHALYYYVLRIPAREDSREILYPLIEGSPRRKALAIFAVVLLGLAIAAGGILATPLDVDLDSRVRLTSFSTTPKILEVIVDTLDVDLRLVAGPQGGIECTGAIHAFGLPTNEITANWKFEDRPVPILRYRVAMQGLFTDIEGAAHISLPAGKLQKIVVRVNRGDVSVTDVTGGAASRLPELDLHTKNGRVLRPPLP